MACDERETIIKTSILKKSEVAAVASGCISFELVLFSSEKSVKKHIYENFLYL
jgi:hypothetical protein